MGKMHACFCLLGVFLVDKEIKIPAVCPVLLTAKCYNSCAPQDDSSLMKRFLKKSRVLKLLRTPVLLIELYKRDAAVEVQCHVSLLSCVCAC